MTAEKRLLKYLYSNQMNTLRDACKVLNSSMTTISATCKIAFDTSEISGIMNPLKSIHGDFLAEALKIFSQIAETRNQLLLSQYKGFALLKNNLIAFNLPNLYRELNTIHQSNLNLLTQDYTKATEPEVRIFQQDIISTEFALQIPKQEENKGQIKFEYGNDLDISCNTKKCLGNIKANLVRMYKGALESFLGENPDKARHVFTSLRKLLQDLLDEIAPCKEVKNWIDSKPDVHKFDLLNDKHQPFILDEKGKVLRKTKLAFFFRKEKSGLLYHFSRSKNKMIESIINLTNTLHCDLDNIPQKDLHFLMLSAKYGIDYICLYYQEITDSL